MKRVGNIIEKVMKQLGLSKRYNEQKAVLAWDRVVGERIRKKTHPLYARDGKLVVEVENSAWMNELSFLKSDIITKLNRDLGDWVIDDIVFLLKTDSDEVGEE
jgi:predicted nucleic acid-binding Zn ribbon protein